MAISRDIACCFVPILSRAHTSSFIVTWQEYLEEAFCCAWEPGYPMYDFGSATSPICRFWKGKGEEDFVVKCFYVILWCLWLQFFKELL